jgi:hypothetical protein
MMWAGGLTELLNKPLYIPTGLGNGWFDSEYTLVAHNSFVQAYVEDGLIGGGAFMGAFVIGIFMLFRLGSTIPAPPWVVQARHYGLLDARHRFDSARHGRADPTRTLPGQPEMVDSGHPSGRLWINIHEGRHADFGESRRLISRTVGAA